MRTPAPEETKLKAWIINKKDEGRAEWAIEYLRKLGYRDYPEIEDPVERLLQQVASQIHYPRFKKVMDDMKQARRSLKADMKRNDELKRFPVYLTVPHKEALTALAKANKEPLYKAIWRLIDEAGQAQVHAETRLAGRHKTLMLKQKNKYETLEQSVSRNTLPMLMRGQLSSELMALKDRHYQLEVIALQWLRELCQCHILINDAGIRSPLNPDQLAKAEVMFETSIKGVPFLGQEIDPHGSLQQLLDLGEMDFLKDQPISDATHTAAKERKPRKVSTSKKKIKAVDQTDPSQEGDTERNETQAEAAILSGHEQEYVSVDPTAFESDEGADSASPDEEVCGPEPVLQDRSAAPDPSADNLQVLTGIDERPLAQEGVSSTSVTKPEITPPEIANLGVDYLDLRGLPERLGIRDKLAALSPAGEIDQILLMKCYIKMRNKIGAVNEITDDLVKRVVSSYSAGFKNKIQR